MKLEYDADTERFRAELIAWLEANMPTPEETTDRPRSSGHLPDWARRWQRRMFDAGWLVPGWPPELGGRNATPVQQMVYFEEMAERQIARSFNVQGVSIVAPSIVDFGDERQKAEYALPTLKGDKTAALGMSEPGAGSDLAGITTRAVLDGDHFVVNGQKVWTSGAQDADYCFCFVRTDADAPKHKGISALLIDLDTPGIAVRPLPGLGDPGKADFNEVFLSDVVVPRENLVGEMNRGWAMAQGSLAHERGMLWILQATRLERTINELVARATVPGPGGRLADDALVRDRIAKLYVDAKAMRFMGYRGFAKFTRGQAASEHSILKLFGSEALRELYLVATEAEGASALDVSRGADQRTVPLDFESGRGPLPLAYFGSFGLTIAGGTSEIQRNIVAERVLGLPRV